LYPPARGAGGLVAVGVIGIFGDQEQCTGVRFNYFLGEEPAGRVVGERGSAGQRGRVADERNQERAASALEAMGLSISDAIRLLMLRIADEHRLPFEVNVPNATTKKAIAELEAGNGKKFASVDELMADLHADD